MLHAFHAGAWDRAEGVYGPGSGRETWAYLPSALLPYLKHQNFTDPTARPAITVSGSPVVADFFLPGPAAGGGGRREWRTILVGTAGIAFDNRGGCFALDVTDPYDPRVLWERAFPDAANLGFSRGAAAGPVQVGGEIRNWVFLTASYRERLGPDGNSGLAQSGSYGINTVALDLLTGEPVWEFRQDFTRRNNVASPPAIPALLDHDDNGVVDFLVFGDLDGRLWVLHARDGTSVKRSGGTDRPVYPLPAGNGQPPDIGPIDAGVALHGGLAIFAAGGVDSADAERSAALYAVRIQGNGTVDEAWSAGAGTPDQSLLQAGEKIWGTPVIDGRGRIYLTTGADGGSRRSAPGDPAGHIRILDLEGRLLTSLATQEALLGGVAVGDGVAVATDSAGENYIIGTPSRGGGDGGVKVKVFSWRLR
jgi:Tfp pilus tip-associated adhesin PilY1